MSEMILAAIAIAIIASVVLLWKKPWFKKYRRYVLIVSPVVFLIITTMVMKRKNKDGDKKSEDLRNKIEDMKEDLKEVQMETAVEVNAARAKNQEVLNELQEVKKIEDKVERRKRLASMIG